MSTFDAFTMLAAWAVTVGLLEFGGGNTSPVGLVFAAVGVGIGFTLAQFLLSGH